MRSTLLSDDVILLLKDVSDTVKAESMEEREKLISQGKKAYEMIPMENIPTKEDFEFYEKALEISVQDTAWVVKQVAEKIYERKGQDVVLVSLIRGGLAVGILIKRYLEKKYKIKIPHYALTLVGTKGIDEKALEYILEREEASKIQFVDGWTGKGAVSRTLAKSLQKYEGVSKELAVLSDPANIVNICGTHDDILIANACLNAPLAGLLSRAIPYEDSFFGAVFFENMFEYDRTYHFIDTIEKNMDYGELEKSYDESDFDGLEEVKEIAKEFGNIDIHFIKPGVGETIRAFIRKKPDMILVNNEKDEYTKLVRNLAEKRGVEVKAYPLRRYKACGIYMDKNSDVL